MEVLLFLILMVLLYIAWKLRSVVGSELWYSTFGWPIEVMKKKQVVEIKINPKSWKVRYEVIPAGLVRIMEPVVEAWINYNEMNCQSIDQFRIRSDEASRVEPLPKMLVNLEYFESCITGVISCSPVAFDLIANALTENRTVLITMYGEIRKSKKAGLKEFYSKRFQIEVGEDFLNSRFESSEK